MAHAKSARRSGGSFDFEGNGLELIETVPVRPKLTDLSLFKHKFGNSVCY